MSVKSNFHFLFREFQFFAGVDATADWTTSGQNYAVSEHGHKIAIADILNKKVFIVSVVDLNAGADLIDEIKNLAVLGTANDTTIKNKIGNTMVYYDSIDLSKDPIYKQALVINPDLNSDVGNFATWITALSETARSIISNSKVPLVSDVFTASLFSDNARVHLYSGYEGTAESDSFALTLLDVRNETSDIDGGSYGNDQISVSDSTQDKMSVATKGLFVNLGDTLYSNELSGANLVSINANTAKFTAMVDNTNKTALVSLANIDSVIGTKYDDYLVGNAYTNYFDPGAGNDTVLGQSPSTYHGGNLAYKDRVAYWNDSGKGIIAIADATANSAGDRIPMINVTDTFGGKDKLYNISYVVGSIYADTYTGAVRSNTNTFSTEFSGLAGVDTINGNNSTRVSYIFDQNSVTVNLSSAAIKDFNGNSVAANTALDGFGYVDKLKDIWGIRGSAFSDLINMGANAEVVTGEDGNDTIFGNNGNDNIWGNAGNDIIIGGSGIDLMVGRSFSYVDSSYSLPTGDIDTFKFNKVTDSSGTAIKTVAGANVGDIVLDFEIDYDIIDLSSIDANAKMRGDQSFKIDLGNFSTFNKAAGQLIFNDADLTLTYGTSGANKLVWHGDFSKATSTTANNTQSGLLIQGDIQGDGKADFSIFLVGVSSNDADNINFIF